MGHIALILNLPLTHFNYEFSLMDWEMGTLLHMPMCEFDPDILVGNPSVEELKTTNIKKVDLKYISKSYGIPHHTT